MQYKDEWTLANLPCNISMVHSEHYGLQRQRNILNSRYTRCGTAATHGEMGNISSLGFQHAHAKDDWHPFNSMEMEELSATAPCKNARNLSNEMSAPCVRQGNFLGSGKFPYRSKSMR